MINILHLITGLYVGGAETMLYKLVKCSDRQQFRHSVVSMLSEGPLAEKIRALDVSVYSLNVRRGIPSLKSLACLCSLIRRESPVVFQTWMYHADLMGLISAWLTGPCRVVWNIRCSNIDMHYVSALNAGVIKLNARLSWMPAAVIVNSEAGRVYHEALGYHPRRWVMIHNGFDLQQFKPDAHACQALRNELGIRDATPVIGLVARFDPQKDHGTFLRAAGILARRDPSVRFVLAGAGVTADNGILSSVIAQEHLEGRVHLLGLRSDVARLISALDIASSSSLNEGFPNALGEAMACGVPCVVTDVGDSAPIVGETGIVVPPRNPGALAEGWMKLICLGAEGRHQLGLAARERIRHLYSLESVVRQYEELYLSLSRRGKV